MKLILTLLGVVLLVVAAVYFLVPADQLPSFFPGHETGLARIRSKHGIASGVAGVVLLAAGILDGAEVTPAEPRVHRPLPNFIRLGREV